MLLIAFLSFLDLLNFVTRHLSIQPYSVQFEMTNPRSVYMVLYEKSKYIKVWLDLMLANINFTRKFQYSGEKI